MGFQVGDWIVMLPEADNAYAITKGGAVGVVVRVDLWGVAVKFDIGTLTNYIGEDTINGTFTVSASHMELYEPDGKWKSRIDRKINMMWKRSKYYEQHCMV